MVRGPRQVGKTTAQFQIIADLLDEGVPPTSILRVQFEELASLQRIEDPILAISRWFERKITGARFNALARDGQKAYLFFDEIQNLDGWDAQLKFLVDNASVKVVVTAQSRTLRIESSCKRLVPNSLGRTNFKQTINVGSPDRAS